LKNIWTHMDYTNSDLPAIRFFTCMNEAQSGSSNTPGCYQFILSLVDLNTVSFNIHLTVKASLKITGLKMRLVDSKQKKLAILSNNQLFLVNNNSIESRVQL